MKKTAILLISSLVSLFNLQAEESELFNVLSIPNGAYIVKAPKSLTQASETSNKIKSWTKEAIIDGTTYKGWNSHEDQEIPIEFIFELSEECDIEKFGFNTECEREFKGICAKNIKVEVSTVSAKEGFKEVLVEKLEEYQPTKYYPITATKARWIKLTILLTTGISSILNLWSLKQWVNIQTQRQNLLT